MRKMIAVLSICAAAMAASIASAATAPAKVSNDILVDNQGMTLYSFDKDTPNSGKSACNGGCAKAWPPLLAEKGAEATGKFSIIQRDDGTSQWAYDGKPLYLYQSDKQPGDRSGDNFKSVWHVVPE